MARPRKSIAQARMTGAFARHPERYRDRVEPPSNGDLGEPPGWLSPEGQNAWREFAAEGPWLNKSHRGITAIAASLRARLAEEPGVQAMNLLRLCLGQMGLAPGSAFLARTSPPLDPADKYFQ